MAKRKPSPKKPKALRREKITVYISARAKEIYDKAAGNEWAPAQLIGELADAEIFAREEEWKEKAHPVEESA